MIDVVVFVYIAELWDWSFTYTYH